MSTTKKFDGWAAQYPSGELSLGHVAWTRRGCIDSVLEVFGPNWTWKKLYRYGWRIVKVNLVPADD